MAWQSILAKIGRAATAATVGYQLGKDLNEEKAVQIYTPNGVNSTASVDENKHDTLYIVIVLAIVLLGIAILRILFPKKKPKTETIALHAI